MAIETERKFLIVRPAEDDLYAQPGLRTRSMVQTYLSYRGETERRIRKITENGSVCYIYTEKTPIPDVKISRREEETVISAEEYALLMKDCETELEKTRFSFPSGDHIIEIDIYPHEIGGDELDGLAVMEIELENEDDEFTLPDFIEIREELTGTRKFSNKTMAKPKLI